MAKIENTTGGILAIGAVQQALAAFAGLTMVPLLIARGMEADALSASRLVSMALLCCGLSMFLQCGRLGWVGSGYLLVMGSSSLFIAPCIAAGRAGGVALVCGMTLAMAPVELLLAPLSRFFKRVATPSVTGTMVVLLALSVLPVSMRQFGGGYGPSFGDWRQVLAGVVTIGCTIAAQRAPWRLLRTGSLVWGLAGGYVLGAVLGLVSLSGVSAAAWVGCPRPFWYGTPAFSWDFVLPFGLSYMLTTLETYGDIHAIAHVCGESAVAVEPRRVTGGLLADGLGSLLSGLLGTTANTTFSGNVAIAQLSGVKTPRAGFIVGGVFVALSFLPKLSAVLSAMPAGVLGGSMLVACAYLLYVGLELLSSQGAGDWLVPAVGVIAGLGMQVTPELAAACPGWVSSLLGSSVCVGAVAAMATAWLLRLRRGGGAAPRSTQG